jgi:hypothetical protein
LYRQKRLIQVGLHASALGFWPARQSSSGVDRKAKHIARIHSDVLARLAKSRFHAASLQRIHDLLGRANPSCDIRRAPEFR